jgi:hypothetical protein
MRSASFGSGLTLASGRPLTRSIANSRGAIGIDRRCLLPSRYRTSISARSATSRPRPNRKLPSAATRSLRPPKFTVAPGSVRPITSAPGVVEAGNSVRGVAPCMAPA